MFVGVPLDPSFIVDTGLWARSRVHEKEIFGRHVESETFCSNAESNQK